MREEIREMAIAGVYVKGEEVPELGEALGAEGQRAVQHLGEGIDAVHQALQLVRAVVQHEGVAQLVDRHVEEPCHMETICQIGSTLRRRGSKTRSF